MKKRKWCYIQNPTVYEMSCDICGGRNVTWSEFEHLIWCFDCKKDTPGNKGIFDGPIALGLCAIMGIYFDRISIRTGKVSKFSIVTGNYGPYLKPKINKLGLSLPR